MKNCWFVTGTDTNVGKTIASVLLLKSAREAGFYTAGYKPVASDGKISNAGIQSYDAIMLKKYSTTSLSYNEINPICFHSKAPPHFLSVQHNTKIKFSILSHFLKKISKKADWIIVEGAGGWHTPLSEKLLYSDWVRMEKLSVILVVNIKLGCINHSILTKNAILQAGLVLSGWIANSICYPDIYYKNYLETLNRYLNAPMLGKIPYLKNVKYDICSKNLFLKLPDIC